MKIIVFEPNPDLSTNPTLINLIRRLSADGILVEIYQPKSNSYLQFDIGEKNLQFFNYCFASPNPLNPYRYICFIKKINVLLKLLFQKEKIVIIAVDPRGVVEAYKFCKLFKLPFVYFSFEIFFMDELKSKKDKELKKKEIEASKKAAFIVIQDPDRCQLLANENGLPSDKMFYLPVAPSASPVMKKTEYLREKYCISKEKIIVIHAGSFSTWTYANELIENARFWHEDFILIVHTRTFSNNEMKLSMARCKASNIIFSEEPLKDYEYQLMLASADIGLVLYKPNYLSPYTGKNIETMGLSSGKFSYYMKFGLPTISIRQPCYDDLLAEYKFGMNIDNIQKLPLALLEIKQNYSLFSSEAKRLFDEKLNFDLYYQALKERILQL